MVATEIKQKIHQEIDSFSDQKLEAFFGIMTNFLNESIEESEWVGVSEYEINGIYLAINQIKEGKGIPHEEVMSKFRAKYAQ
jgi:hypothetical protein